MASNFNNTRNRYRKVMAYGSRLPRRPDSIVNTDGTVTTIDLNNTIRHYDPYMIGVFNTPTISGEYQEALVQLLYQDSLTVAFSSSFTNTPYVTLEIYPSGPSTDFVNPYLTSVSTTGFTFGLSAPTTGIVKYKAIYAASYPVSVERAPLSPGVFVYAYAGAVTMLNESTVTMTFSGLTGTPEEHTMTPYSVIDEQDVYPDRYALSVSGSDAELSSHLNGTVQFIALKS